MKSLFWMRYKKMKNRREKGLKIKEPEAYHSLSEDIFLKELFHEIYY